MYFFFFFPLQPGGILRACSSLPKKNDKHKGSHLLKCPLSPLTARNLSLTLVCQTSSGLSLSEVTVTRWPAKYLFLLFCGGPRWCLHPAVSPGLVVWSLPRPPRGFFLGVPRAGFWSCHNSRVLFEMTTAPHHSGEIPWRTKQTCPGRSDVTRELFLSSDFCDVLEGLTHFLWTPGNSKPLLSSVCTALNLGTVSATAQKQNPDGQGHLDLFPKFCPSQEPGPQAGASAGSQCLSLWML